MDAEEDSAISKSKKRSPETAQEGPDFPTQHKPPGIQLSKKSDDELEAVLGTGSNVLLKISMNLKRGIELLEQEHMEVPVTLFLTDFTSSPTSHPAIHFTTKIDCESTTPICVLPDKPRSFGSYLQFTDWLNKGYFKNQVNITYDFQVDVHKLAPALVKNLFFIPPGGYRLIGTNVVDNPKLTPDDCTPKVTYCSERREVNATTITLSGMFYLNKKTYKIDEHHQAFLHSKCEEKVFKKDDTKIFYHHKWLARSEIISTVTYEENSPGWPNAPSERYSLVLKKPGSEKKTDIQHLECFDGNTGEYIDIVPTNRTFLIFSEEAHEKHLYRAIVTDEEGKFYIVKYKNLTELFNKFEIPDELKRLDYCKKNLYDQESRIERDKKDFEEWEKKIPPDMYWRVSNERENKNRGINKLYREKEELETKLKEKKAHLQKLFSQYQAEIGAPHPKWEEFSKQ